MMVDLITKNIAPIRQLQATRTVDPYPYTVDIDWGAWFEFTHNNYRIYSTIQNRKGQTIHRIRVKSDVRKWLDEEHNQYGIKKSGLVD